MSQLAKIDQQLAQAKSVKELFTFQMVALDIEGFEWPEFTKDMTTDQINQHKPMLRTEKPKKNKKEDEATLPESELDF